MLAGDMSDAYHVLIVDDDAGQSEMLREFLRLSGFPQVDVAGDLESLWQQMAAREYHIVLLDYRLPDGNGIQGLQGLHQRGYTTPVVMVTGQGDERTAVQAIQSGAADYLIKSGDYLITLPALIRKTVRAYELQMAHARIQKQVEYQAALLNNVRDAVVVWDMAGKITYWNPAAVGLYSWSQDERLGEPVETVYLRAFTPPIAAPREGDTAGQHVVRQCRTRSGATIWVSSRISALHDADGRLFGFMDVSHDMTRRVEAEQALRRERNFIAAVLDTVGALVIVLDPGGRIVRVNRAAQAVTGHSEDSLRRMNIRDLYRNPGDTLTVQEIYRQILTGQAPFIEYELELCMRSGERRVVAWTASGLRGADGRIEYIILGGLDMTERRRAEQALRESEARYHAHLTQAARLATIGEMASGVAHQINNPLTTIIAESQLLLREVGPGTPGRESAEAIEQAGWRVQQVVQRLVEFSRADSESFGSVTVNETIRAAAELVGAHIESLGVALEIHLQDGLPRVRANSRQLTDLWVNLLVQARDAIQKTNRPDGRIRLIARSVGPGIRVEVEDNGLPVPADDLAVIFEPDFVKMTAGRGTGMELSICREIVRQHGGEIQVENRQAGHTTAFQVNLPCNGNS
jgi:PAS domain S-box-containing protein